MAGFTRWLSWPLLRTLLSQARLSLRLVRDPAAPWLAKTLPLLAVAYVVLPLDVVPDLLPFAGQLDDLGVVLIVLTAFLNVCPARVVEFHRAAVAARQRYSPMPSDDDVLDVEFHRDEE